MLREVHIIREEIVYERHFGKPLRDFNIKSFISDIRNYHILKSKDEIGSFDYFNYRISFIEEKTLSLIFIFVNELTDVLKDIKIELFKFRKVFMNLYSDLVVAELDKSDFEILNPTVDAIQRSLKPKISLVGFSGVGKTTIANLIANEKTSREYKPFLYGDITTLKIGKLYFSLWDFAGKDRFSFLWNKLIKGSDVVLLISDSTLENVEKSKFFIELIKEEAPYARSAIIANKQDLPDALDLETIERISGLKTYSMIAIEQKNQIKVFKIFADILDLSIETFTSLEPLHEREKLIEDAVLALKNEDFKQTTIIFDKIAKICFEIGDEHLGKEFYTKAEKIKQFL
ncbi:MAG TPA: GTP-binding protein [archaeon]|nr:GTP-binding protein [archaeon]